MHPDSQLYKEIPRPEMNSPKLLLIYLSKPRNHTINTTTAKATARRSNKKSKATLVSWFLAAK
jgi:hypothetical protein